MENFLTYEYVATYMGIVFCTSMVVEFLKELPIIKSIPTRYFTFIVASLLLFIANIFNGQFIITDIPLILLNGILITYTATGGHNFHYKKVNLIEDKDEDTSK